MNKYLSGVEGLHMVPMEPITIAQDGNNITIRSDVTLTDEALQTIAQIATSSTENASGTQPQEAQISIATSEGIPIIARVQFTTTTDPEIVSYITQIQEWKQFTFGSVPHPGTADVEIKGEMKGRRISGAYW